MTNLVILPPDIPFMAEKYNPTAGNDTDYPVYNLVGPRRDQFFRFSVATTVSSIFFEDPRVLSTRTADFLVIARADTLKADGCTAVKLEYFDGAAYQIAVNDTSFASATLYGPNSND